MLAMSIHFRLVVVSRVQHVVEVLEVAEVAELPEITHLYFSRQAATAETAENQNTSVVYLPNQFQAIELTLSITLELYRRYSVQGWRSIN